MMQKKGLCFQCDVYRDCNPDRGSTSESQTQTFRRAEVGLPVLSLGRRWLKHSRAPQLIDSCAAAVAQVVEWHKGC